ncbi:MAG: uroporphyrinogen decarboxylase family protein [Treponema sp.]|jgi:uroporphyrinogen decarboxylase|nr:uroporphyrinogen decarboxylase family protein [Treponema sp.]
MKLHNRKPDIENLYKVLRREEPSRPTLFELFMNRPLYERLAGRGIGREGDPALEDLKLTVEAYAAAGFDYATAHGSDFYFKQREKEEGKSTLSLNEGYVITDEASFDRFEWREPGNFDYSRLEKIRPFLPEGMKLMVMGPGGVLENVINLTGYENLCLMLYDNPELAGRIFNEVGKRLLEYYEISLQYDTVGLLMSNDDWGFKTQTFLRREQMQEYVFPWHKKFADLAHRRGIPATLHSCGCFNEVMDDTIEYMGFDGKHSYEDAILPVEDSYEKWHSRIAILGGIDVNFIIRGSEEEISARARAMLKRAENRGGYALGTGNSVPEFIPQDHYIALLKAALSY